MHNPAVPLCALRDSRHGKGSKRERMLRDAFISESAGVPPEYLRKDIKRKHTDDTRNRCCRQACRNVSTYCLRKVQQGDVYQLQNYAVEAISSPGFLRKNATFMFDVVCIEHA